MCRKKLSMKTTMSSRSRTSRRRWMFVVSSLMLSVVVVGVTDVVRRNESHMRPLIEVGRIERTL
jgi:hypothetical protein